MITREPLETSFALAEMDALAARLIARARPVRFGIAQTPAELEAVYRLRYRTVITRGWAGPEDFSDGLERDAYDATAIHIGGWDGTLLVAASRFVLPMSGHPLPTEEAAGLEITSERRMAEVGRLCVAPEYSSVQHRVFWGLLCRTWVEMRAYGFTEACGTLTPSVARMYRSWGLQVVKLGAARRCWGQERYRALIRPAESVSAFTQTVERLRAACNSCDVAIDGP